MLYQFQIAGVLPTYDRYGVDGALGRRVIEQNARRRIASLLDDAPRFPGKVFVAFVWVRPSAAAKAHDVSFAQRFVLGALVDAGVIESTNLGRCCPYDLDFRVNPKHPRTVVYVADSQDEILAAERARCAHA